MAVTFGLLIRFSSSP